MSNCRVYKFQAELELVHHTKCRCYVTRSPVAFKVGTDLLRSGQVLKGPYCPGTHSGEEKLEENPCSLDVASQKADSVSH